MSQNTEVSESEGDDRLGEGGVHTQVVLEDGGDVRAGAFLVIERDYVVRTVRKNVPVCSYPGTAIHLWAANRFSQKLPLL